MVNSYTIKDLVEYIKIKFKDVKSLKAYPEVKKLNGVPLFIEVEITSKYLEYREVLKVILKNPNFKKYTDFGDINDIINFKTPHQIMDMDNLDKYNFSFKFTIPFEHIKEFIRDDKLNSILNI